MAVFVIFIIAALLVVVAPIVFANMKRRDDRHRFDEPAAQGRDRDAREHHH